MLTPGLQQVEPKLIHKATLLSLLLLIIGRRRHSQVVGDSMLPTLKEGDIVIYRPIQSNEFLPQEGTIAVVKDPINPSILLIKRIYKVISTGIDIRGDNIKNSIDSRQFGLVNRTNLCGIVEQVIRKDK